MTHRIIATAFAILLCSAETAGAGDGRYVQLYCADPRTGTTIGNLDPAWTADGAGGWNADAHAACDAGQAASTDTALALRPTAANVPRGAWTALRYRLDQPGVELESATLWRAVDGAGLADVSTGQHTSPVLDDPFGAGGNPLDRAAAGAANARRGDPDDPFSEANRVAATTAGNAFTVTARCDAPAGCGHTRGDWTYALFGARLTLRDSAAPTIAETATGALADGDPTPGDVTVGAADLGSGMFQASILIDDEVVARQSLAGPLGADSCRDRDPAAGAREVLTAQPCPTLAWADFHLDTRSISEGKHRVRVMLEDVGGNTVTAVDRVATFDNVPDPAPLAGTPPTVGGDARTNAVVSAQPGGWRNAETYTYAWQRCAAGCTPTGATGATYVPGDADVGYRLRVEVTGRNKAGETAAAISPASAVVSPAGERRAEAPAPAPAFVASPAVPSTPLATPAVPVPNGAGATRAAKLTLTTARRRLGFRDRPTVRGRLIDAKGQPLAGATIALHTQHAAPGAPTNDAGSAATKADGSFALKTSAGPSRTITASYRAFSTDERDAVTAKVRVVVGARLHLSARPARVGKPTLLTGRLVDLPRAGVQIQMQAKDGANWRTFDVTTTRRSGAFRYGYRFKRAAAGRAFLMRVVVDSPIYPFARAASRPVLIRVPG